MKEETEYWLDGEPNDDATVDPTCEVHSCEQLEVTLTTGGL